MSRKINVDGRLIPVPCPPPDASLDGPKHPIMFPTIKSEVNNIDDKSIVEKQQQDTSEV